MDELKVKITSKSYRKKDTDKIKDCQVKQDIYSVTGLTGLLTGVLGSVRPVKPIQPSVYPPVNIPCMFDSNSNTNKDWSVLGDLNDPSMGLIIDTKSKTIRQQTLEEHTDPKNWDTAICDDCRDQFSVCDDCCAENCKYEANSSDSESVSSSDCYSESDPDEEQEEISEWIDCLKEELYHSLISLYTKCFYLLDDERRPQLDLGKAGKYKKLANKYISEFCNNLENLIYDCYIDLPKRSLQDVKVLLNLCENKCSNSVRSPRTINNVIYEYLSGETKDFNGKSEDFDQVIESFFCHAFPFKNNCRPIPCSSVSSGFTNQTPSNNKSETDDFMKICQEIMSNPSLDNFSKLTSGLITPDLTNKSTIPSCPLSCCSSFSLPSSRPVSTNQVDGLDFLINLLSQYTSNPEATKESKPQSDEQVNQPETTQKDDRKFVDNFINTMCDLSSVLCQDEESKKAVDKVKQTCTENMDSVDSNKKNPITASVDCITNAFPSISLLFNKIGEQNKDKEDKDQSKEQSKEVNDSIVQFADFCENIKNICPSLESKERVKMINNCFQESFKKNGFSSDGLLDFIAGSVLSILNPTVTSKVDTEVVLPESSSSTTPTPTTTQSSSSSDSVSVSDILIPEPSEENPCLIGDMSPSFQEDGCDLSEKDIDKSVNYSNNSTSSASGSSSTIKEYDNKFCETLTSLSKQFCTEKQQNKIDKLVECYKETLTKTPGPDTTADFISSIFNKVLTEDCLNDPVNEPPVPYPSEPDNNNENTTEKQEVDDPRLAISILDTFLKAIQSSGSNNNTSSDMKPSWIHLVNPKQPKSNTVNDLISLFSTPLPDTDSTATSTTESTTESTVETTDDNSKSEVTIADYDSDVDQFLEC